MRLVLLFVLCIVVAIAQAGLTPPSPLLSSLPLSPQRESESGQLAALQDIDSCLSRIQQQLPSLSRDQIEQEFCALARRWPAECRLFGVYTSLGGIMDHVLGRRDPPDSFAASWEPLQEPKRALIVCK